VLDMRVIPALDLREGACVQLVGGSYEAERVRLSDPVAVAEDLRARGFGALHLVDLDAATRRGSNRDMVYRLLSRKGVESQVGGGVRTLEDIGILTAAGASRVIVGTRAIEDPEWLAAAAARYPETLILATDFKSGTVVTRGWSHATGLDPIALLEAIGDLPLAGVLVTAVDREGRLGGTDLDRVRAIAARVRLPIHAAGGIASLEDLRAIRDAGASAAVVGMALYTGVLDPAAVRKEFQT
jgi:phosphoribosylformimino-5-aminoimidazole carboxamide ribotide isomerase